MQRKKTRVNQATLFIYVFIYIHTQGSQQMTKLGDANEPVAFFVEVAQTFYEFVHTMLFLRFSYRLEYGQEFFEADSIVCIHKTMNFLKQTNKHTRTCYEKRCLEKSI